MTSLWLDRSNVIADDPINPAEELDDIIVGAGLTGLVTALMLAQSGHRVAVIEARTVGAAATGNTTAHRMARFLRGRRLVGSRRGKCRRASGVRREVPES